MDNRPIGMFDSGVGGLTVYKEIKKTMPNERIIYIGDTKRFPYGSKTKETIIDASKKCIDFLISKDVKEIIIACGTASSMALDTVKNIYKLPITGIIKPTIKYIKNKKYKNVGVMATRGTIESMAWERELNNEIEDINVFNQACPLLAPMAEEGWTDNEIARLTIKEYLKNFIKLDVKLDAIILGCTHYPLFQDIIKEEMHNVEIINTGKLIAEYLKNEENYIKEKEEDEFYLTDTNCNFAQTAKTILGDNIKIEGVKL